MKFSHLAALVLLPAALFAQKAPTDGSVAGIIHDAASGRPVEYAAVVLKNAATGQTVTSAATDGKGAFSFDKVPLGDYRVSYNLVGGDVEQTANFKIDAAHRAVDLGELSLGAGVVKMDKVEVKTTQSAMLNSIDRKTYNVGKEIQSTTGTVSDLLQNIPSVNVDIDGNVSLRGSDNVMILINGRTSTLMGKSRAEVLQQLPADSIEKIEVITNPSAKYKPDGTAGIINIALKKKRDPGYSGTLNVAVGNDTRGNAGLSANYNPGKYNLFASYSVRQDDRERRAVDNRTITDPTTGAVTTANKTTVEHARPFSRLARAGADYTVDDRNHVGFTGSYNRRVQIKRATDFNFTNSAAAGSTSYDRLRFDPEFEVGLEFSATWQHTFPKEGHELNVEVKSSSNKELEDNHYSVVYRSPVKPTTLDNTLIGNRSHGREAVFDYVYPIDDESKLEAGYNLTDDRLDQNFVVDALDPVTGKSLSNRFKHDESIHAFYVTYGRAFGKLGVLAGLRPELAYTDSNLVTLGQKIASDYRRVYPSLHLAWHFNDKHEVQANYSHRVHRPESDELNPFPEYSDPFNLRAGNPRLLPEDIHSFELGYGYKGDAVNFTSTVYHRELYHGFTSVTRSLGGGVLLSTRENLSQSRSSGLEFAGTADFGKLTLNLSSNIFFNTIDASNLGFASNKSNISSTAKLGASWHFSKTLLAQLNTNYNSSRLTPQGFRRASYVANLGLRQDLAQRKYAIVLTVSDVFNSLKEESVLNTPLLHEEIVRRRSSRIVYVGVVYNFGKQTKKSKDDPMKFDNSL